MYVFEVCMNLLLFSFMKIVDSSPQRRGQDDRNVYQADRSYNVSRAVQPTPPVPLHPSRLTYDQPRRFDSTLSPQTPETSVHAAPVQSYDDTGGMLLVSAHTPHYTTEMHEKLSSVREQATKWGILPEKTAEMKRLQRKMERLEEDLKAACKKTKQQQKNFDAERVEWECKNKLLMRQLDDAEDDYQKSELIQAELRKQLQIMSDRSEVMLPQCTVKQKIEMMDMVTTLRMQLEQMRVHKCTGDNCQNCPFRAPSSYGMKAASEEVQKETMVVSGGSSVINTRERSKEDSGSQNTDMTLNSLRQCMDEWYWQMEKHFEEKLKSEIEKHHFSFFQANTRMKAAVSHLVKHLSGDNDINIAGLKVNLQWLKKNLESSKVSQCTSSLENYKAPKRTSSWP